MFYTILSIFYALKNVMSTFHYSSKRTSLSSTSNPRYSLATTINERRVIDGRIELDFGVTNLPSLVMNMKLAPPVSSTLVLVAGSRLRKEKFSSMKLRILQSVVFVVQLQLSHLL